jgi:hypothetical protein
MCRPPAICVLWGQPEQYISRLQSHSAALQTLSTVVIDDTFISASNLIVVPEIDLGIASPNRGDSNSCQSSVVELEREENRMCVQTPPGFTEQLTHMFGKLRQLLGSGTTIMEFTVLTYQSTHSLSPDMDHQA